MKKKLDIFEAAIAPLKYKMIIILVNIFVLAVIITLLYFSKKLPPEVSYLPNIYTVRAKLFIPSQSSKRGGSGAGIAIDQLMSLNPDAVGISNKELVISLLYTHAVVDEVIRDCYLIHKDKIREAYETKNTTIEDIRTTIFTKLGVIDDASNGFVILTYTDIDPAFAKAMVDTFLAAANKATHEFALNQTVVKKRFIEARLNEISGKLKTAQNEFVDFQQKYGIISPTQEARQITDTIGRLRIELDTKQEELERYNRTHKVKSHEQEQLEYEIERLKERIKKLTRGTGEETDDADSFLLSKLRIAELSQEYENLRRQVENFNMIYTSLLNELEIVRIQEKSEAPVIQVIDPPEIPSKKSGPARTQFLLKGMLGSVAVTLLIPILIAFLKQVLEVYPDIKEKLLIILKFFSLKKNK